MTFQFKSDWPGFFVIVSLVIVLTWATLFATCLQEHQQVQVVR